MCKDNYLPDSQTRPLFDKQVRKNCACAGGCLSDNVNMYKIVSCSAILMRRKLSTYESPLLLCSIVKQAIQDVN